MNTDPHFRARAAQGRLAGLVIAASAVFWIGSEWLGARMGWSNRTLGLVGLAAMGGFAFGLILAFRLWLQSRKDEG